MTNSEIAARNIAAGNTPPEGLPEGLTVRSIAIVPRSFNAETLTVDAVLATENRVPVWDWTRYEIVDEVLPVDALREMPDQLPLLDSHRRESCDDQMGSTVPRAEGKVIAGTRRFSPSDPKAVRTAKKVGEGHMKDGSIGYKVHAATWIDAEETREIFGVLHEGPVRVATDWELKEDSVTPIGADVAAKVRSLPEEPAQPTQEGDMSEFTAKVLQERGLKADATEDEVRAFLDALQKPSDPPVTPVDEDALLEKGRSIERKSQEGIREWATIAGIEEKDVKAMIDSGKTVDQARGELLKLAQAKGKLGGAPVGTPGADDQTPPSVIDEKTFGRSIGDLAAY